MHYMPDTEGADSAAEKFWPEGYKQVIREDVRQLVGAQLNDEKGLRRLYQQRYSEKYTDLDQFTGEMAGMIAIGAENGADDAFEDIITTFLAEASLPEVRRYARYFWPQALPQQAQAKLCRVIVDEYSRDEVYSYAYKAGYQGSYRDFTEFISRVAQLVVTRTMNGADDMLEAIYRSFVTSCPLPPARRRPRRLKNW